LHTETSLGDVVTITGANGTTATGERWLDYCSRLYRYQYNSLLDLDQISYQATTGLRRT